MFVPLFALPHSGNQVVHSLCLIFHVERRIWVCVTSERFHDDLYLIGLA